MPNLVTLSRRAFLAGASASVIYARNAKAWIHGSTTGNPNRVTLNALNTYANLAKGITWAVPPASADANGYPTGALSPGITANPAFAVGYFGDYVLKWSGTGSFQFNACSLLLRSASASGIFNSIAGTSGDTTGNPLISSKSAPSVTIAFGALVQGMSDSTISNGAGGTYIKVTFKTNYVNDFSGIGTLNQISIQDSSLNGSIVGQRNSIGIWNYVQIDGSNIYLTTNTATGAVSAYNSGSAWVSGGEGITPAINLSIALPAATYTSFTNLVICKSANATAVGNGQINDPDFVTQATYLMNQSTASFANRGWLRFMDMSNVQGSYECDFSARRPATAMSYLSKWWPYFNTNGIASSDGTNFTCNSGRVGAYQDLEIIQAQFSATNTSTIPTLNDNSRGAAPIFSSNLPPTFLALSAGTPSPGTDHLVFSFSATWLNSGSPYTFTYPTVSGDGTESTLSANLYNAMVADTTLSAAKLNFGNPGNGVGVFARTAQAGALTITYTSGPAIVTITRVAASVFPSGDYGTFVYNQILGGWLWLGNDASNVHGNGMTASAPFEQLVELCNQSGSHCWYNWPVYTKAAFITAVTQFFGDGTTGLTSGLRFGTEVGNELWNFSQAPFGQTEYLGYGLGLSSGSGSANETPQWSWGALRTIQYADLSKTAWTGKGRALSDHYIFQMGRQSEAFSGGNFQTYGLQGTALTTSNTIYATYSGLSGGLAAADYSTSGNRPADKYITATGFASYWFSDYIRETANGSNGATLPFGTVSDNATWLQAAKDYGNGLTAQAFNALSTLFNTRRGSAPITSGTYNNSTGQVVLTLASTINAGTLTVGDLVYPFNLTGTGALSSLNGNGYTSIATTSGTTVTFNAASGLGSITITGGILVDRTAGGVDPNQAANWQAFALYFANFESIIELFDSNRVTNGVSKLGVFHYEGAPQWSVSNSALNGTNSITDTTTLASQITSLSWNVSSYTLSGTNSASEMAQMVVNLLMGWKWDLAGVSPSNAGTAANTSSYDNMIKTFYYQALVNASAGKGREIKAAQYGYQANIWGLFPVNYELGSQYTSYNAIHEWNAGSG